MMSQTLSSHPPILGEVLRQAVAALTPASPTPRLDAEVLVMHVLGLSRAAIITRAGQRLGVDEARRLEAALARRRQGEPIPYITGTREFWSMELRVSPATLIPRPETELLVERALACIPPDAAWTLADVGAGCGAIALALARERPRCRVIATDDSTAALAVAHANARALAVSNIDFREGAWLTPLSGEKVHLIASNPPYVRSDDPHLEQGDARFEPRAALAAGPDGLDAIRAIAHGAVDCLQAGGWLWLEHGYDQAAAVREALSGNGYRNIVGCKDLAGHDRITGARRP